MLDRIRTLRRDEGFTLIELLMVIVILGVLAGVVVFAVSGINDKGEQAACRADVKTLEVAQEAYYAKKNAYATTFAELKAEGLIHSATAPASGVTLGAGGAVNAGPKC
ncbi:competence type IV pilus major pilin ComGC [Actinokineospora soli]|uniref:Competence type IV pilus major pilin ComGC n=1 Tax=Actinokineospora soli TaxID=1048753 RepID=A0ABW2TS94_9PSEU